MKLVCKSINLLFSLKGQLNYFFFLRWILTGNWITFLGNWVTILGSWVTLLGNWVTFSGNQVTLLGKPGHLLEFLISSYHKAYHFWETGLHFRETRSQFWETRSHFWDTGSHFGKPDFILGNWVTFSDPFRVEIQHSADMVSLTILPRDKSIVIQGVH